MKKKAPRTSCNRWGEKSEKQRKVMKGFRSTIRVAIHFATQGFKTRKNSKDKRATDWTTRRGGRQASRQERISVPKRKNHHRPHKKVTGRERYATNSTHPQSK